MILGAGVELTTLTKEFFMPRFLERDEALRRKPWSEAPWDGVAEVRPFGAMEKKYCRRSLLSYERTTYTLLEARSGVP